MTKPSRVTKRLLLHITVLTLCVCGGALQTATALGSSGNVCAQLDKRQQAALIAISSANHDLQSAWKTQSQRQQVLLDQEATQEASLYNQVDQARDANLLKLKQKATTAVKKEAVQQYAAQIQRISHSRRTAASAANKVFAGQFADTMSARQAALSGQTEAYRIAVTDAYTHAKGLCAAAVGPVRVEATLQSALVASRTTFIEQRAHDKEYVATLQTFSAARNKTVDMSNQVFWAQAATAQQKLADALGK